ncbi:MAG: DUF4198 domain-containing protein [Pyrinomonadaceae bacterium]
MTKRNFSTRIVVAAVLAFLLPIYAFSHEYFFEPESFFIQVNQKVDLRLFVGEGLKKEEERPFQAEKVRSFRQYFGKSATDVKNNQDNSMPFFSYTSALQGNQLFTLERDWSYIKLEPQKFDDYLREDGMEYIIAERAKLGESQKEGRERYSRFIKTLLQVGETRDNAYRAKTGMKLDITPLENPYAKKPGDNLAFQIMFNGKPLVNRTVFADNRDGETISKQRFVTDSRGKVNVKLDRKGTWLVRLVVMQRCKIDCGEADWESFWGAFSFGLR